MAAGAGNRPGTRAEPSEIGLLLTIHSIGSWPTFLPAFWPTRSLPGSLAPRDFLVGHPGLPAGIGRAGFWSLAILIAIAGMGDAAWHPIATGMLVRQMPDKRGQALGITLSVEHWLKSFHP